MMMRYLHHYLNDLIEIIHLLAEKSLEMFLHFGSARRLILAQHKDSLAKHNL